MLSVTRAELLGNEARIWYEASSGSPVAIRRDGHHDVVILRTYTMTDDTVAWERFAGPDFDDIYHAVAAGRRVRVDRQGSEFPVYLLPIEVFVPENLDQEGIDQWVVLTTDEYLIGPVLFRESLRGPEVENGYPILELRIET